MATKKSDLAEVLPADLSAAEASARAEEEAQYARKAEADRLAARAGPSPVTPEEAEANAKAAYATKTVKMVTVMAVDRDYYNPFTRQVISATEPTESVEDGWLKSQIEYGYIKLM